MPVNTLFPFAGPGRRGLHLSLLLFVLGLVICRPAAGRAADPVLAAVPPMDNAYREAPAGARNEAAASGLRVELTKSAPAGDTLRVGGAASFEARLLAGDREAPAAAYLCRWRSDAGARFLEVEGAPRNTAVFMRPGRQRIWVEAVPRSGPSTGLAAVSNPVDLVVANPAFGLSVMPPVPLVGEEVTVAIRDFPLHDGVEFRWDPLPPQAKLISVSERGLTFYPTDAAPVAVKVTAAMSGASGGDLGTAKAVVTAKALSVAVENRGLAEPPAVVWRDGEGPVPADGVAVGQKVRLRSFVTPTPRHPPLTFTWGLCPGGKSQSGASGREILVSRQETGPCRVTVDVRDGRDILLGRGEGEFTVAVSQKELDTAAANIRETERLVETADKAWQDGQVDRAWEMASAAVRLSPGNGPALAALERIVRDKNRLDALLAGARKALSADDFGEVKSLLGEAGKVNPRAAAIGEVDREAAARRDILARVGRLLAEARDKWDAGEVEAALSLAGRALDLDPGHATARAERERMVAGRDRLIGALKQAAAYLAGKRFDSAAAVLAEARSVNVRFPAIREMEQAIAARKERAWRMDERLARARDQWNAGDADGALGTLTEACALDPEHAGAAAARKSLAEAREHLAQAEDRAEAALAGGDLDAARAALDAAGRVCPRHPRLAELAGAVKGRAGRDKRLAALRADAARRFAAGDLDGAVLAADDMVALAPGDKALAAERDRLARARDAMTDALRRAKASLDARRYDLALASLAEAEKVQARSPAVAQLRERVLAEKGKAEGLADTWMAEVRARLEKKDFSGAREALAAAKKTGPLPPALEKQAREAGRRIEAGLIRQEAAKREQAARDRGANAAADADRRARCGTIGREAAAKRTAGDHAGAIRSYQTLLELCPDTCQAYNNVGASLYSLGYLAESVPWFDEAMKCDPGERLFRDNAAMTRTKLAKATQPAAETAKACATTFATAESHRTAGELAEALKDYQTVVARCPDFCAAYNNMGLTLHKLGRPGESLPLFEQALRCNPKDNLFRENYDLTAKRLRAAAGRP